MPGKVNPVIPEAVAQAAIAVMGCDQMIVRAPARGQPRTEPFLPLVADSLLTSLDLLARACRLLADGASSGSRPTAIAAGRTSREPRPPPPRWSTARLRRRQEVAAIARPGTGSCAVVVERGLLSTEEFDSLVVPRP